MAITPGPLKLNAPTPEDKPKWSVDYSDNMRKIDAFAEGVESNVGDMSTLQTEEKEKLVLAINEVYQFEQSTLDTQEEVEANTLDRVPAGAKSVKSVIQYFKEKILELSDTISTQINNLSNRIDTVNSNLTNITSSPYTSSIINFTIIKNNSVKLLKISGTTNLSLTANTSYTIGNVSNALRPYNRLIKIVTFGSTADSLMVLYFETNGDITIKPLINISSTTGLNIAEIYI